MRRSPLVKEASLDTISFIEIDVYIKLKRQCNASENNIYFNPDDNFERNCRVCHQKRRNISIPMTCPKKEVENVIGKEERSRSRCPYAFPVMDSITNIFLFV